VEYTEYEVGLTRQTNIDRNYGSLSTTSKLLQPPSFGHSGISVQMSEQNKLKSFKIAFPLLIPIMIIRTPKMW